ncbi:FAD-dependent oxidoreductase [Actinoplanes sp. NPDC051494]|uniref:FAD-dependent oxidoreductase n=1 Tax=Actinoplanes sp. NPDC051494 TaxID=3363907 RepID=UPI0037BC6D7B
MQRIVVVGAGIGGLTAALALTRAGVRCVVLERGATLDRTGGGIQIPPAASAVLHRLGMGGPAALGPVALGAGAPVAAWPDRFGLGGAIALGAGALDRVGLDRVGLDRVGLGGAVEPGARELRRWSDNSVISRTALQGPAPHYTLRRTALCRALLAAAGPACVLFGQRVVGIVDHGDGVVVRTGDGTRFTADAVVGADGLRSSVRAQLSTVPLRYSGHAVYRAVVPAARAGRLAPMDVVVWLGPGRHCVAYPIDGGRSINIVATVPAARPPRAAREVVTGDVLAAYEGWHPAVRGLLALAGPFDHHGLFDREDLPTWHRGRVVLLGDAAHPMLPFAAQGAAQAIEDAAALAAAVHRPDAFAHYEAVRRPAVARAVALSRAGATDHHLPDGPAQRRRDDLLRRTEAAIR